MAKPPIQTPAPSELTLAQNLEAEQSVLGAAMMDEGALQIFLRECLSAHFHRDIHHTIYRAIVAAHEFERPVTADGQAAGVDIITVADALHRIGKWDADKPRYLRALIET